ncbi:hypothetical protein ASG71_11080 [Arthrobacter sp. Soil763]|nr:hypothetical protein [Arthrobacter sp. Soil763]KRE78801.1 hypothetical protein ASG71_11080 [Arthrobacter sp. Soil763]
MGIGVAIGVIAVRKLSEAQSSLGPEGLNRAVGRLTDGVYDFADAVRAGMRERETELRTALGVDGGVDGGGAGSAAATVRGAIRR